MLTKDEQKNQNAQRTGVQNTNLDDVLLGRRVKIARKEKRLTQEELAGLCNCTPTHICNIENGKIDISLDVRRHIVGGANRTLISVLSPLRLCRTGTCRRLLAE